MKPSFPSYADLNNALDDTTLKLHPAQVHGLICGMLCGNPDGSPIWQDIITGDIQPGSKAPEILQTLYTISAQQLKEFLFEFQLLLPPDTEALPVRAEALTLWCQGLLTGLKLANVAIIDRAPSELTEAINDMIEIAKMNYEDVIATEEDETAYAELVEYVRMAVILIYQDLQETGTVKKPARIISNQLH